MNPGRIVRHTGVRLGETLRCLRRAHDRHGLGYGGLLMRFADLYGRRLYSIAEIEYHGLLGPQFTPAVLDGRQSKQAQLLLQQALNPAAYIHRTEDKIAFDAFCREAGLPIPRCLGAFRVVGGDTQDATVARDQTVRMLAASPVPDLILKPTGGVHGRGIFRVEADGPAFRCHDGRQRSAAEVYDWIARESDFTDYLAQERVRAHADIARLSGTDNLQTVRMVTYVAADGRVVLGCCQLRIIAGSSVVDNFHDGLTGNLIGDIPGAGGVVSEVHGPAGGAPGFTTVAAHPVTGAIFRGFTIPCWEDACRLVQKAARAFLPLRTIGWDVAITADGPLLIEGNVTWDPAYESEVGGEILRAIRADTNAAARA